MMMIKLGFPGFSVFIQDLNYVARQYQKKKEKKGFLPSLFLPFKISDQREGEILSMKVWVK